MRTVVRLQKLADSEILNIIEDWNLSKAISLT